MEEQPSHRIFWRQVNTCVADPLPSCDHLRWNEGYSQQVQLHWSGNQIPNSSKVNRWRVQKSLQICFNDLTENNYCRKFILDPLLQVCYADYFENLKYPSNYGNASEYVKVLFDIGPGFDSTFMHCFWRNNEKYCNESFKYFLTEEGLCYTFNSPDQYNIFRNERFL